MDDRGRIYQNPTDEQIKNKKLLPLSEDEMKHIRQMNEIERKTLYSKKREIRKSNGPFGKDYFDKKEAVRE